MTLAHPSSYPRPGYHPSSDSFPPVDARYYQLPAPSSQAIYQRNVPYVAESTRLENQQHVEYSLDATSTNGQVCNRPPLPTGSIIEDSETLMLMPLRGFTMSMGITGMPYCHPELPRSGLTRATRSTPPINPRSPARVGCQTSRNHLISLTPLHHLSNHNQSHLCRVVSSTSIRPSTQNRIISHPSRIARIV